MVRFRFRIGSVLILIVLLGVGFAALREADELWDNIVLALTIGVLLVSVLLAIHRGASKRAFWVGFALFGWAYFGLTALPSIEPRLMTTKGLVYLDSKVPGRDVVVSGILVSSGNKPGQFVTSVAFSPQGNVLAGSTTSGSVRLWSTATGKALWVSGATTESFVRIGHSLFVLVLAWLGAKLSRRLHVRNRENHAESDNP